MLKYKGYTARVQFDNEKKCLKGITKIGDYEIVFFGNHMPDLKRKFEALVDQVEMAQPPKPKIESGFGIWQSIRQSFFIEFIGNVIFSCFTI